MIEGFIYDITLFLPEHPGGAAPCFYAGKDATTAFFKIHASNTLAKKGAKYRIGKVSGAKSVASQISRRESGPREFGDHMAAEGETSNIPVIITVMYLCLGGWAIVTSQLSDCYIWTVPAYYFAAMIAFYGWHLLAHSEVFHKFALRMKWPYLAEMYQIHMEASFFHCLLYTYVENDLIIRSLIFL